LTVDSGQLIVILLAERVVELQPGVALTQYNLIFGFVGFRYLNPTYNLVLILIAIPSCQRSWSLRAAQ